MRKNVFLILFIVAIFPLVSSAQSSKPFSQLEFDRKASPISKEKKLEAILGDEDNEQPKANLLDEKEKAKLLTQYSGQEYTLEEPESFLTPRIKGPATDTENNLYITSAIGWPFTKGAFCKIPDSKENFCKKTKALKEVLNRFSGNDDFFEVSCERHSCPSGESPTLSELEFSKASSSSLEIAIVGNECKYSLQKGPIKNWMLVRAQTATCSCLPADCLN